MQRAIISRTVRGARAAAWPTRGHAPAGPFLPRGHIEPPMARLPLPKSAVRMTTIFYCRHIVFPGIHTVLPLLCQPPIPVSPAV